MDVAAFKRWCATEALPQLFKEDEDDKKVQLTSKDLDEDTKETKAITAENDMNDTGADSNDQTAGRTAGIDKNPMTEM